MLLFNKSSIPPPIVSTLLQFPSRLNSVQREGTLSPQGRGRLWSSAPSRCSPDRDCLYSPRLRWLSPPALKPWELQTFARCFESKRRAWCLLWPSIMDTAFISPGKRETTFHPQGSTGDPAGWLREGLREGPLMWVCPVKPKHECFTGQSPGLAARLHQLILTQTSCWSSL